MMKKKRLLFFGFFLLLFSCDPIEYVYEFVVEGKVYYPDGTPVYKAFVSMPPWGNRLTDEEGYFIFDKGDVSVAGTEYTLSIIINGYVLLSEEISVEGGEEKYLSLIIPYTNLPEVSVVDVSSESEWDVFIAGEEECAFLNINNSFPKSAVLHSFEQNKDYSISFDEEGFPRKVVAEDYIFLFDNFNGNKVDFAIVSPSGDIQIIREAESDFNWDTDLDLKGSTSNAVKWFGRAMGAIPCITTGAAALVSGGAAIPLALWTCGNYLLKMAAEFTEDQGIHNNFTEFVGLYSITSTAYNCTVGLTNPVSCLTAVAQGALEEWAEDMDELEEREDEVRLAEATLYAGYGDIQITLTWNNESDLDLHVIDPFGEEIYWSHKTSASGGYLDYDDTNGYGPENIYWPEFTAPNGRYQIFIHDFPGINRPLSANFIVSVNAFGNQEQFEGSIELDETMHIVDFDENGFIDGKSSLDIFSITIAKLKNE